MKTTWSDIAAHMVARLGVQAGELVQVRDNAGRLDALIEVALAIELRGATPLVQLVTPGLMGRMLDQAPLVLVDVGGDHVGQPDHLAAPLGPVILKTAEVAEVVVFQHDRIGAQFLAFL